MDAALKLVKEKTGTAYDTVALELICQQFMGIGVTFKDLKTHLVAERKKSASSVEFLETVVPMIKERVPDVVLTVSYGKEPASL